MQSLIQFKRTIPLFFIPLALACFALLPQTQAVTPAPDGCYGNFTTAEGCHALAGLGSGAGNTGIGWYALFSAGNSNLNTGIGAGALALNTGDSNTAVGAGALLLNTSGSGNTAMGDGALQDCTGCVFNVAIGRNAGPNVVQGNGNIYIGENAQGPTDEDDFVRIGDSSVFAYDSYIVGIFDREVSMSSARLVYVDGTQKIGTELADANGNRMQFKPQAILEESLKQQKRISELEATVERQQKGMELLTAQLKEQAAQIQKVNAQLELSKPAPQTVKNNQ